MAELRDAVYVDGVRVPIGRARPDGLYARTRADDLAVRTIRALLDRNPVGDYNPDWAITFQEGRVKHAYFVAETKGSLSSLQLKGAELAKIDCARKFFASLGANQGDAVKYDVVTDYGELMQLVGAGPA